MGFRRSSMFLGASQDCSLIISYVTITQLSLSYGFFICLWIANHDTFDFRGFTAATLLSWHWKCLLLPICLSICCLSIHWHDPYDLEYQACGGVLKIVYMFVCICSDSLIHSACLDRFDLIYFDRATYLCRKLQFSSLMSRLLSISSYQRSNITILTNVTSLLAIRNVFSVVQS